MSVSVIAAPQEWVLSIEELLAFADEIGAAAVRCDAATLYAGKWAELHEKYLKPSDEACLWCKAKATCPAKREQAESFIDTPFTALSVVGPADGLPNPEMLGEVLGLKLDLVDQIEDFCKAVRAEAERRLVKGEPLPSPNGGYKLVTGKKGRRQWIDAEKIEATFKTMRLKVEEMYDFKLISPTSAEKLAKAGTLGPKQWAKVQDDITQASGKLHVAPMSDARPAVAQQPVEEMFGVVTATGVSMEDLG